MTTTRIAALTAALALTVTPALAAQPERASSPNRLASDVGVPTPVEGPQPPATEAKPRGKAYGRYCRGESKKHVKGRKGTAFSRCVKAMARLDRDERKSARAACKAMKKGVERRQCIKAARELARAEAEQDEEQEPEEDEDEDEQEDVDEAEDEPLA